MSTAKRIATSTLVVFLTVILCALVWLYEEALDSVYSYEQNSKLSEQPEYYYAEFFGSRLLDDSRYDLSDIDRYYEEQNKVRDESTEFMQNIKKYNANHKGIE